jgi:choline monooxygenase
MQRKNALRTVPDDLFVRGMKVTKSFDEILGKDAITNLQKPIETAKGLPAAAYTSQEFFDLEQERLSPRTWMGVAFAEDVASAGDAIPVTVTVTGRPLIIVRDKKGVVRAFHNVCRHRATIVLLKPEKGLSNLSCSYHAWAWDLEGNLRATPYFDGTPNSKNFSVGKEENGLVPVRCGVYGGVVFVNLASMTSMP